MNSKIADYTTLIREANAYFWNTRNKQLGDQIDREVKDAGNRGAVNGGKQMDGFVALLAKVALDAGVPDSCIYTKNNQLPGYFRPTKDWDFLIISPTKKLIAVIEFKSQVGSFGNNFNNRTEEALGSAVDLWTAFRENVFPHQQAPWVGYLMAVERSKKSTTPVRLSEPHFGVMDEFKGTSYIDRYSILCRKLILERHYTSTALLWSSDADHFGDVAEDISIANFLSAFSGYLHGVATEFKR
jgi:hypothetical protein